MALMELSMPKSMSLVLKRIVSCPFTATTVSMASMFTPVSIQGPMSLKGHLTTDKFRPQFNTHIMRDRHAATRQDKLDLLSTTQSSQYDKNRTSVRAEKQKQES